MPTVTTVTVKSTGGDYSSLSAAEAGEQADLVSADVQLDIECYAFDDTTTCNFNGWTTDATRYIRVFTATGEGHQGVWSTSKYRRRSSSGFGAGLTITEEYVRIEGIQCYQPSGSYTALIRTAIATNTSDIRFDRCLLNANGSTLTFGALSMGTGNHSIRNTIAYGSSSEGIEAVSSTAGSIVNIDNCTVVNCGTYAYAGAGGNETIALRNCYGDGATDAYTQIDTLTTCMHSSATSFSGSTGSTAYDTNNFTNVTGDSEDLHLPTGSALLDAGTDLSADFTTDIDGDTRTRWSVGADDGPAAGGGATPKGVFGLALDGPLRRVVY